MSRHKSRRRFIIGALLTGIGGLISYFNRNRDSVYVVVDPLPPTPPPRLKIITRDEWGAREPNHQALSEFGFATSATDPAWYVYPDPLPQVYNTVAIHHSASLLSSNETMRDVQDLHMEANHWADVGYHYAIDKNGALYEGRDINVRGSSVAGFNTGTIGVVVMGNFEYDEPLELQLTVLQTLINWLTATYSLTHLAGHGEFNPESVCPGKNMLPYLDTIALAAGLQRGTDGHVKPT